MNGSVIRFDGALRGADRNSARHGKEAISSSSERENLHDHWLSDVPLAVNCQEVHMPLPLNVSGHNLRTSRRPRGLRTMAALEWIRRPNFLHVLANFRRLADDRRRAVVALAIHRITAWL